MDPLSQLIRQSMPRSVTVGATDVGGEVAIRFAAHDGAFFYSVAFGECCLQVDASPESIRLRAGDCVVLPSGRPFVLASNLSLPPIDAAAVFEGRSNGSIASYNGGGRCMMFAAHFEFEQGFCRFLFSALDPVVQIRDSEARLALRDGLEQMIAELQLGRPGCEAVVEHLAHIALIKVLRFHLAEGAQGRAGWLYALADKQLSAAISAMQADPSIRWTVASLASIAAMSRTAFATRFKAKVGIAPMDYLGQFRMLTAAKRLADPGIRLAELAQDLGYDSESAFSAAFKRVMGMPPKRYADHAARASAADAGDQV